MNAIRIENLRKEYKDIVAVDNLNLEIKEGELFSLLGVNGAGKTTTIKMLSTLTKPTSGEAFIYDYSILKDEDKIKEIIDVSMQETAIARKLTVEENIEFYAALSGKNKEEIEEYFGCRDSYFGFNNQHINEKGFKIISEAVCNNVYKILIEKSFSDCEDEKCLLLK